MNVLIFGGSSGIGRATLGLFTETDSAIFDHRTVADLKPPADSEAFRTNFVECDVTSDGDVLEAFRSASSFGDVDTVIYTAGLQIANSFEKVTDVEIDRLLEVNVKGAYRVARTAVGFATEGSITLVSSVAGLTSGGDGLTAYGMSKAAVIGFTRSLAMEIAPEWRVNCVAPGWTDTSFNDPVFRYGAEQTSESLDDHMRGFLEQLPDQVPLGRMAEPHEIAAAVAFLASDEASYITGHTLVVDGGMTL